jgi:urease beta subunit
MLGIMKYIRTKYINKLKTDRKTVSRENAGRSHCRLRLRNLGDPDIQILSDSHMGHEIFLGALEEFKEFFRSVESGRD